MSESLTDWPVVEPPITDEERELLSRVNAATKRLGCCGNYDERELLEGFLIAIRMTRGTFEEGRKASLKDDPRYERVKELVAENPPPAGVRAVIPRRIWREAGFTDEEIDERHSLGRNLR